MSVSVGDVSFEMGMFVSKTASLDLLIQLSLEEPCLGQDPFLIKACTDKSCKGHGGKTPLL